MLSTIIVTWNSEGHIGKCLQSLAQYGPANNQVIVVDNHSTDGTRREILGQVVDVKVWNPANYGLGYATCQAYLLATADLILVANPDIIFNGLPALLDYATKHPDMDVMMPALNPTGKGGYKNPVHWHRFPHFLNFSFGSWLDKTLGGFLTKHCLASAKDKVNQHNVHIDDRYIYGVSCMLLRRSLIDRIGGIYRPHYRWAWADADFGMRLAKHGAKGTGVPEAQMQHHGAHSTKNLSPKAIMYLAAHGQKCWEKDWGHSTRYFTAQFLDTVLVAGKTVFRPSGLNNKIMFLKGWLS